MIRRRHRDRFHAFCTIEKDSVIVERPFNPLGLQALVNLRVLVAEVQRNADRRHGRSKLVLRLFDARSLCLLNCLGNRQ